MYRSRVDAPLGHTRGASTRVLELVAPYFVMQTVDLCLSHPHQKQKNYTRQDVDIYVPTHYSPIYQDASRQIDARVHDESKSNNTEIVLCGLTRPCPQVGGSPTGALLQGPQGPKTTTLSLSHSTSPELREVPRGQTWPCPDVGGPLRGLVAGSTGTPYTYTCLYTYLSSTCPIREYHATRGPLAL